MSNAKDKADTVDPESALVAEWETLASLKDAPASLLEMAPDALCLVASGYHQRADEAKRCAEGWAVRAVQEAARAGWALKLAKAQLPHGNWQDWLKQSLPEISYETARRYVRLVEWLGKQERIPKFTSISEAYRHAGILPKPDKQETRRQNKEKKSVSPNAAVAIRRVMKLIEETNVETLSENEREELRDKLRPIAEFWKHLR